MLLKKQGKKKKKEHSPQGSSCHSEYWFGGGGDVHTLDPSLAEILKPQPKAGRSETWSKYKEECSDIVQICNIVNQATL